MTHPRAGFPFGIHDLESGLYESAHWIWDRRATAKRTGFPFGEETVTETILMDLGSILSHSVHIVPFNKVEEGKVGADWEWCLYDHANNRYLRFLVQAKLLDDQDQLYAHVDRYIGNSGVRQIDRLADTSKRRGVPAIYVFYNHVTDSSRVPTDTCKCHACLHCWGASVAPLPAVLALLPDKSFDTLSGVSFPWLCLLCAGQGGRRSEDTIDNAIAGLQRLDQLSRERLGDLYLDIPRPPEQPDREPPDYLAFLSDASTRKFDESSDATREKLRAAHPGLDGVVLVDVAAPRPDFEA
ncbi:DUF6615 family protein [uncultured Sphingosinicella sp.]|uniref:DUF6615 family protein n=1 Tax=uncultured Sphingosinicella sp. TaxID=478748 RepID=UPI0030DB35D8|tara:strand:+ start:69016 stop:69906 length:891 start_codon:yes stop_codon:yes gene_type:complete